MQQQLEELIDSKINYFANNKGINEEQLKVITSALKKVDSFEELNALSSLFDARVGFGFKFDAAPHIKDVTSIPVLQKDLLHSIKVEQNPSFNFNGSTPPNDILIIGENLEVLQNLLITHKNRIDIIYIDPPYNTGGSDLGYKDKFSKNAWLNLMKQRMEIAYELLSDDGVGFISLDDNMQAYFKVMMDNIFGEENFICNLIWDKKNSQNDAEFIEKNHEYILMYSKNKNNLRINKKLIFNDKEDKKYFSLLLGNTAGGLLNNRYKMGQTVYWSPKTNDKIIKIDYDLDKAKISNDPKIYSNCVELIEQGYIPIRPNIYNGKLGCWKWSPEKMNIEKDRLIISKTKSGQYTLLYKDNRDYIHERLKSIIGDFSSNLGTSLIHNLNLHFSNPKPIKLIKYLINLCPKKDNQIILDFFAGSGTTGQAVWELNKEDQGNRQFILCTKEFDSDNNQKANNIGYDVCFERLYRISTGKSTNNESFEWLKKNEPFYKNLDVYKIKHIDITINHNKHNEWLNEIDFNIYNTLNPKLNLNKDNAYNILAPLLDHIGE